MQSRIDEEIHLLDYWRVLQKRRRVAIAFFAVIMGSVVVYSFATPPIYRGTAQILLNLDNNPTVTFTEGGTTLLQTKDSSEYFNTQTQILTSRTFADRVVRKLQLDKNPYFIGQKTQGIKPLFKRFSKFIKSLLPAKSIKTNPVPLAPIQEELDPDLTQIVLDNTTIDIGKGSSLILISYDADDSMAAAAMANGIASAYIEYNIDIRVKPFRDAVEWLSARKTESQAKVEDSEKIVQRYKERQGIVSFEEKENVITQKLQELVTQLVQAESKRQEAEVHYRQIESAIQKPELLATIPDIANNLVIQGLRTQELDAVKKISELSEKYGPKHPQMIKAKTELETVRKNLLTEARKMLSSAKTDYDIARGNEEQLKRAIDVQKMQVLDLSRKAIDYGVIEGEAVNNKQFYDLLLKKLQEASLSSGINISNAQIVDSATVSDAPVKPKRLLNILLGMFVGAMGSVLLAFFLEYIDDTIKTPDEVEKILGQPFLGYVPSAGHEEGPIYMFAGPRASVAESYRTIRTGIMLSSADESPLKVVLVTSTTPNEGKTTTAANLAVAMAQMGERVLLIDTDMRRHNLHKVFKLENLIGISDMIMDPNNVSLGTRTISDIPNLSVVTGGTLAPNPSELLGSVRMRDLIGRLRKDYDRIILDSPPHMAFSDCLVLSRIADGVVYVVWGGETGRDNIKKALQSIKGVGGRILGIVINNMDLSKRSSYYYYYQYHPYYNYYYGDKEAMNKEFLGDKKK